MMVTVPLNTDTVCAPARRIGGRAVEISLQLHGYSQR
jgi:hypothetical protein